MAFITLMYLTAAIYIGGHLINFASEIRNPDKWSLEDHSKMMRECSLRCGEGQFGRYKPTTGECTCSDIRRNQDGNKKK